MRSGAPSCDRLLFERNKVGEIRKARQTDDGHVHRPGSGSCLEAGGQAVFVIELHGQHRDHAEHRFARQCFELREAGTQNRRISAKFVNDKSGDLILLCLIEEGNGAVQAGKHAAAVNIPCEQDGSVGHPRHAHVDVIAVLEIDLRGAACAFEHDYVVLCCKGLVCTQNVRNQFLLVAEVVGGAHHAADLAVDAHLAAHGASA